MNDESVSSSLQPSYILHYREFQETSFIVDAFTLAHGRIALVAKSARSGRPAVRSLYQPFRPLLLSWVGAGELRTLTGIEETGPGLLLHDVRLACGYYINELILRLLGKDQPQSQVFAFYAMALSELEQQSMAYESVLRTFELQLLDVLGVLPNLLQCTADGTDILAECEYLYHPANALAVPVKQGYGKSAESDASVHPDGITSDEGVRVHGRTLIAMHHLDFSEKSVLLECRTLMRQILRVQLGDRPLKSRELFATLAGSGRSE